MADIPHNIGKIEFELVATHEKNARELQQKISGYGRKEIPDILEETFDNLSINNDSRAVIDKLEIDLGEISLEEFDEQFLLLFKELFSQKLSEIAFDHPEQEKIKVFRDRETSDLEILKEFLLTGSVPWYAEGIPIDILSIFKHLTETNAKALRDFLKLRKKHQFVLERLVYQFPEQDVLQLVDKLNSTKSEPTLLFIKQLIAVALKLKLLPSTIYYPEQLALQILIATLIKTSSTSDHIIEIESVFTLTEKINIEAEEFIQKINKVFSGPTYKKSPEFDDVFVEKFKELAARKDVFTKEKTDRSIRKTDIAEEETEETVEEGMSVSYYITNAGLVLISPFLPELFRKLKLINGNEFIDEIAWHKAIHLSQYAVFGNKAKPEHLLILNKILCGYPLQQPIPIKVALSRQEKTETTRMLQAAIKHWAALKNTSAEGFRTTFLQRNGLLKPNENNWQLFVERNTFDILIDRIPWNYNIVKLPWMEKTIEVEW